MIAEYNGKIRKDPGKNRRVDIDSSLYESTGHAFREKCNLHTDYNNQEIFVFELVRLKVDTLNFSILRRSHL